MTRVSGRGRLIAFAVLVLLQALVVVALVVREERLRAKGIEIVLQAQPVDPRDLLRGDYVILGYQAQSISSYRYSESSDRAPSPGEEVLVELERNGRYWEPVEYRLAGATRPASEPGAVFLRGTVEGESRGFLRVNYPNLDRYYVPEGTGNLPKPPDVVVIVDRDGNARIQRLEIDGQRWPLPR